MKKLLFAVVPLALMLTLALGACGKPAAGGGPGAGTGTGTGSACTTTQTVSLGQVDFVDHCVTVSANQPVTFDDPASTGGIHIICTGQNAQCVADATAPKDLASPGFQIQPGQKHEVTFTQAGTYKIACTVHPAMNLTLIVK